MRKWSVSLLLFMVLLSLGACSNIEGSEPELPATTGFAWEVIDGIAWLRGMGSVTEGDIVIPAKVMLCENDGTWTEDSENGTEYSVIVSGDAFKNCELLHTVTFHSGVQIENNQMYKKLGMFTKCENLEGVYNIPDSVISMRGTFTNCTSLREISNFPAALTDLTGCFTSCTSLPSVPIIPDSVEMMADCFQMCVSLQTVPNFPAELQSLNGCFKNCSSLAEIPAFPEGLADISDCFHGCTTLTAAPDIPDTVTDMDGCFRDCTVLLKAPKLSANADDLTECFQGCSSLEETPYIPDSVTKMTGCFQYCEQLTEVTNLPANVIDISRCFAECSALLYAPKIPDSVQNMSACFVYCDSLQGTVTIPRQVANNNAGIWSVYECPNVEVVQYDTCQFIVDTSEFTPNAENVFLREHYSEGLCEYCGYENKSIETDDEGIAILFDNVSEYYQVWFKEFIENEVPEVFQHDCDTITLTDDLGKYSEEYAEPTWNGFASGDRAYIKCRSDISGMEYTIFHELGHCFDFRSNAYRFVEFDIDKIGDEYAGSIVSGGRAEWEYEFSQAEVWMALHEEEGAVACWWYNQEKYWGYTAEQQRRETFAIAVGKYFTDPAALQLRCPGMYAYMDELFGDAVSAETEE